MQIEQPSCDTPSLLEEIIDSQQTSLRAKIVMSQQNINSFKILVINGLQMFPDFKMYQSSPAFTKSKCTIYLILILPAASPTMHLNKW